MRGIFTPERTPPPSPEIREFIDGVLTEPAPYEEDTDDEEWMDTDAVGAEGGKEEEKKKKEGEKENEDKTFCYPINGHIELSDSNKGIIKSYAEQQGKNWASPDDVYELCASLIQGSQPTPRLGQSGR